MSIFPYFAATGVFVIVSIAPIVQGNQGRMRPPESVTCPRNDLTVYAGRVTSLDRQKNSTTLTIATDWKTTERVTITHKEPADPDGSFLLKGKPFVKADWDVIAQKGTLRENVRANAWVCRDGRVVVDFSVPPSNPF